MGKEHRLFLDLGNFEPNSAVNSVFDTIIKEACKVRDLTISADSVQIAADAAAISAIWSFGLSMAAFAALEASEEILKKEISSKQHELNKMLKTADADVAGKIDANVFTYVNTWKKNNNLIASKAVADMDTATCRSNLMQFMASVERHTTLTAETFRQYAETARRLFNSSEINNVYDAHDKLEKAIKSPTKDASLKKKVLLRVLSVKDKKLE